MGGRTGFNPWSSHTKDWYLMPPCLTLSFIEYGPRVKWSNPGKGVAPSPTPWFSSHRKGSPSDHPRLRSPNLLLYIYIVIHRQTVSFYQNSSVWLDTQDARSRDRNPSNFTLDYRLPECSILSKSFALR